VLSRGKSSPGDAAARARDRGKRPGQYVIACGRVLPVGLIAASSSLSMAFLGLLVMAIPLMAYCVVKIRKIAF
jgi:hypothetical protein